MSILPYNYMPCDSTWTCLLWSPILSNSLFLASRKLFLEQSYWSEKNNFLLSKANIIASNLIIEHPQKWVDIEAISILSTTSNMNCQLLRQKLVKKFQLWKHERWCFCCLQDKMWIKMPKWTIFEISFLWKHQYFCFHYWDYLTNILHLT